MLVMSWLLISAASSAFANDAQVSSAVTWFGDAASCTAECLTAQGGTQPPGEEKGLGQIHRCPLLKHFTCTISETFLLWYS